MKRFEFSQPVIVSEEKQSLESGVCVSAATAFHLKSILKRVP